MSDREDDSLLDLLRFEQRTDQAKLNWRQNYLKMYELALDACYRRHQPEKAFFFLEKSKAVLLLDNLAGLNAQSILGDSLGMVEFNLQNALTEAHENYEKTRENKWLDAIPVRENQLYRFLEAVIDSFPEYVRVKYDTKVIALNNVLEKIQHTLGNTAVHPFFGGEARADSFRNNSSKFTVFHFNTHAKANSSHQPCIFFYGDSMRMEDFYRLKIDADLFVLGACETNLGDYYSGDGVYSLSRALAYSGVPSIISSLWTVPELPTVTLFGHFYENLKNGLTKSDALYQAKLSLLHEKPGSEQSSPIAWAAWTFAGRDNSLSFVPEATNWWAWLGAGTAFLIVLFLFFKRSRQTKK